VVKLDPKPSGVPPVELAYQLNVSLGLPAAAVRYTVPAPQRGAPVVEVTEGALI
jgi:hypothetical protein